jgi:hypothetical protein
VAEFNARQANFHSKEVVIDGKTYILTEQEARDW